MDKDEIRKELRRTGEEFLKSMRDEVDSCVLLCDVERLGGLVSIVNMYLGYRVIHDLREKGLKKEIRKLCEKAGRLDGP